MIARTKRQKEIWNEASKIAKEIELSYPGTEVEVSLQTQEGEDAYLWITTSREKVNKIRVLAAELAVRLWENKAIDVIASMDAFATPRKNSESKS